MTAGVMLPHFYKIVLFFNVHTCSFNLGNCTEKLDIALLTDTSLSMRKKERTTLYVLASKLIDNYPLSDGGNHYGFITFDRKVKIHHNFGTQLYYNKQAAFKLLMKKKVLLVPGRNQWGTRADIALHKAATELFTSDGGDRPDAKNALLVLTDGKQFMLKQDQTILPFQNFSESTKTLEVSLLSHKQNLSEHIIM